MPFPPLPSKKLVWMGTITSCDNCFALEEHIGRALLTCAGCKMAKYCSKGCQKEAWKRGGHQAKCARLKEDREMSAVRNKLVQRNDVVNTALGRETRATQWVLNTSANLMLISMSALQYDRVVMEKYHLCVYVKCVLDKLPDNDPSKRSYYHISSNVRSADSREFYIDEIQLVPKAEMESMYAGHSWEGGSVGLDSRAHGALCNIYVHHVGACQQFQIADDILRLNPPPMLSLSELITYTNRGLTCFFYSFSPHEDVKVEFPPDVRKQAQLYMSLHMQDVLSRGYEWGYVDKDGKEHPMLTVDFSGRVLPNGPVLTEAEKDEQSRFKRISSRLGEDSSMDAHTQTFLRSLLELNKQGLQVPPTVPKGKADSLPRSSMNAYMKLFEKVAPML